MKNFKKYSASQAIEFVIAALVIVVVIFVCLGIFNVNLTSVFKTNDSSRLASLFTGNNSRTSVSSLSDPQKTYTASSDLQSAINEATKTTGSKSQLSIYNESMSSLIQKTLTMLDSNGSSTADALAQYLTSMSNLTALNNTEATQDAVNKAELLEKSIDLNKSGTDATALQDALDNFLEKNANDPNAQDIAENIKNLMGLGSALDYSVDANFEDSINSYLSSSCNEALREQLIMSQIEKITKELNVTPTAASAKNYTVGSPFTTTEGNIIDKINALWTTLYNLMDPTKTSGTGFWDIITGNIGNLCDIISTIPEQLNAIFNAGNDLDTTSSTPTTANALYNLQQCFKNGNCSVTSTASITAMHLTAREALNNNTDGIVYITYREEIAAINKTMDLFVEWLNATTAQSQDNLRSQIDTQINTLKNSLLWDDDKRNQWTTLSATAYSTTPITQTDTTTNTSTYIAQQMSVLNGLMCTASSCNKAQKTLTNDIKILQKLINGDMSSIASIDTKDKVKLLVSNKNVSSTIANSTEGQNLLSLINVYFVNNYNEVMSDDSSN